jgi:hypothetical protein
MTRACLTLQLHEILRKNYQQQHCECDCRNHKYEALPIPRGSLVALGPDDLVLRSLCAVCCAPDVVCYVVDHARLVVDQRGEVLRGQ